jgi:hypothetical protein
MIVRCSFPHTKYTAVPRRTSHVLHVSSRYCPSRLHQPQSSVRRSGGTQPASKARTVLWGGFPPTQHTTPTGTVPTCVVNFFPLLPFARPFRTRSDSLRSTVGICACACRRPWVSGMLDDSTVMAGTGGMDRSARVCCWTKCLILYVGTCMGNRGWGGRDGVRPFQ